MKRVMNMKTVWTAIFCLIMVIALCACGDSVPIPSESDVLSQATASSLTTDAPIESSSTQTAASSLTTDAPIKSSSTQAGSSTTTTSTIRPTSTTRKTITSPKPTTATTTAVPKTPAQIIVGKWHGSVDMAPIFSEQGYVVDGVQMVSCDVEFTANGVVYEMIDRVSLKTVYTNVFTKMLDNSMAENNLTKEQFEANIGKTYDQYLTELVQVTMEMVPQTIISAYKFEGNDLYMRDQNDTDFEKETYSFSGENKLTIVESGTTITYTRINS